tara:strand:+ start:694 stop:1035 length:342 start_codon:yes stop_codon:yes gene_type:complete
MTYTGTSLFSNKPRDVYSPYLKKMVSQNYVGTSGWSQDKAAFEAQEKKKKKIAEERRLTEGQGKICLDGICKGKTWDEAREFIVGKQSEDYWRTWTGNVRWGTDWVKEMETLD